MRPPECYWTHFGVLSSECECEYGYGHLCRFYNFNLDTGDHKKLVLSSVSDTQHACCDLHRSSMPHLCSVSVWYTGYLVASIEAQW